jgi:hypothetical protein
MARIQISNDPSGCIIVSFPYDPLFVEKVKSIDGRRWHPEDKHWSFPKLDGMLDKILKVFGNENAQVDPVLKTAASKVKPAPTIRSGLKDTPSPLAGEGWARPEQSRRGKKYNFEDLRRELASRKYRYNTVKGYIFHNRDFLLFTDKESSKINDDDIKDYLLYLAEEKESATATINQAINALNSFTERCLRKSSCTKSRGQEKIRNYQNF